AARGVHGEIRRLTDRAGEAEHVGIQPVLQQSRFLNLVGGTMRGGLIDDACQCAKLLGAGGYSRVIHRICHSSFSFGWDFMGKTIGKPQPHANSTPPHRASATVWAAW